ncbi:MAG: SH3 domain-containing protein [Treponema sp.]|nr:SH3 domain-containing protein [Treponema sp.]
MVVFRLKKDGDYLEVYVDKEKKPRETYCYVNNDFKQEIFNLVKNNSCDINKLTWPRHADGSCDYDGSKTTTTQTKSTSSTYVSPNKLMSVTENLKLRSAEATTSKVLTVMSAGTKVKILELGKAETIDGITSNWVKVEVQADAKDRDGNPIKAGTVGWCYGGYLR